MTDESKTTALGFLKTRLNRLEGDTSMDKYLSARLDAAVQELTRIGIALNDTTEDIMLAADYAAWQYQNRDKPGSIPEWLRFRRLNRWLPGKAGATDEP